MMKRWQFPGKGWREWSPNGKISSNGHWNHVHDEVVPPSAENQTDSSKLKIVNLLQARV